MNRLIRLINRLSQDMLFFSLVHTCLYDSGSSRQVKINVVADGDKTPSRASILM